MSMPGVPSATAHSRLPMQAISSGLTLALLFVTGISILLAGAESFGLSEQQTTSLVVVNFALCALPSLALALLLRQPILVGPNITSFLFVVSLATTYSYPEVLGAVLVGGLIVILVAMLGLADRISALVPAPIVFGTVAGAVMPFVVGIFTSMSDAPVMLGSTVAAWLLARRWLPPRIPPILPAMAVGFGVAGARGDLQRIDGWAFPTVTAVTPTFSWQAIVSIAPIVAIIIVASSNLAGIVYLRTQGYHPPERILHLATGASTVVGSLFGLAPNSMGSWVLALVAGPEAGPREQRNWSIYANAAGVVVLIAFAGIAAQVPALIPTELLLALAGLVLVAVLGQTLGEVTKGPLHLGPLFAFVVASSRLTLGGFGPVFWGLAIGMAVTLLLEQPAWQATRAPAAAPARPATEPVGALNAATD